MRYPAKLATRGQKSLWRPMAQGYLRVPRKTPPPTPPTAAHNPRVIATQLQRIANALERIADDHGLAPDLADWEMRERLGLPHTHGDTACPPPHKTTRS